ncbi:hypothetical protein AHF37_09336 [Paragonimus kellicotti]|nr:hypothetical protein AHF37_09336 [Paragonimus kellicotti]
MSGKPTDDHDTHSGTNKKIAEQITPCLQVIHRIDRERIDRFSFRLIALDSGDNRGEVVIRLIVRDINDHAPTWLKTLTVFDSSGKSSLIEAVHLADSQYVTPDNRTTERTRYEFGVKECTTQRKLVQLKAIDLDDPETENGKVMYQIIEQSADIEKIRRRFFISRENVYITELGLRGLRHGNLSLLIAANDGAGAVSEAEIVLHIEDCNDHRPMILIRNSEFIIPENTYDTPHLIGLVTVRDLDLITFAKFDEVVTGPTELGASVPTEQISANRGHPANPAIPDSLSPGTEWNHRGRWSIYRLETQNSVHFDREEKAFYSASLQCADNGVPSLSSSRLITIHISDVNDNPPEFYQEGDQKNTHLPTYHMNQIDPFWPIPISNPVDIPHSVKEQSLFEFSIIENAERGSFIGKLHARDRDVGENARLTFEIIPANETLGVDMVKWPASVYGSDSFTVSVTGELHLIKQLDREEQAKYMFLVRVRDHGIPKSLSTTATVVITVADVNDCPPEFHGEYIFEQAIKPNFELLDISTNLLSSLGSQQRANFMGVVHLEPVYGIIRFTAPIDRERLCPELQGTSQPCNINLIVVAHRMSHQIQQATEHPPQFGSLIGMVYIDLTVTVLDINDHAPYFPKLSTTDGAVRVIMISEECKLGTLISLPMATDADSIEHGVRSYLFHPLSTPLEVLEHFQIVLIPGLGTQCEHLDQKALDHATMSGKPTDDHDTHSGTNKKIAEQITPCLQVIHRIDRERIDRFSFRLIALDSGDNRGEVVIRLIVRDINDHAPTWLKTLTVFDSSGKSSLIEAVHLADSQYVTPDNRTTERTRYEFGVKECTTQRKLVQLKAIDLDDPETENGKVMYQIIEQSADIEKIRRRFFISRENVYITELGLRGLRHGNLSLLIAANDGAGAVSEAEIVLHIEDCNDHRPMILAKVNRGLRDWPDVRGLH